MDSITHGIAGALVGKAFYGGSGPAVDESVAQKRRVAVFAATFGAVFPDSDIPVALLDRTRGAALEIHRGITHSLVCLPAFAFLLALGTWWYTRWRRIASPSLAALTGIYTSVLLLHIFMDLVTSWGTMIWSPLSKTRATLDWTMIVDLMVTTILLLPQVAARSYRTPERGFVLRVSAWVVFSLFAFVEYSSLWVLAIAALIFGLVLLGPAYGGWGFRVRRETWCRAGFTVFVLYMGMQGVAHHVALAKVQRFATAHGLKAESIGALPSAPSLVAWTGLIRAYDGVYYSRINLPTSTEPQFAFIGDSPANGYIEAAKQAPAASQFLWFTRFPVISYRQEGGFHHVEFSDFRFSSRTNRRRHFQVSVTLDDSGRIVDQQWPDR